MDKETCGVDLEDSIMYKQFCDVCNKEMSVNAGHSLYFNGHRIVSCACDACYDQYAREYPAILEKVRELTHPFILRWGKEDVKL